MAATFSLLFSSIKLDPDRNISSVTKGALVEPKGVSEVVKTKENNDQLSNDKSVFDLLRSNAMPERNRNPRFVFKIINLRFIDKNYFSAFD